MAEIFERWIISLVDHCGLTNTLESVVGDKEDVGAYLMQCLRAAADALIKDGETIDKKTEKIYELLTEDKNVLEGFVDAHDIPGYTIKAQRITSEISQCIDSNAENWMISIVNFDTPTSNTLLKIRGSEQQIRRYMISTLREYVEKFKTEGFKICERTKYMKDLTDPEDDDTLKGYIRLDEYPGLSITASRLHMLGIHFL